MLRAKHPHGPRAVVGWLQPPCHLSQKTHVLVLLLFHVCSINVVIYAAVSVYAGSWRSVQVDPPEGKEIMTHKEAAKFPLVSGFLQHLWLSPAIQQLLQLLLMLREAADTSSTC